MEVAIEQYRARAAKQERDFLVLEHMALARHVVHRTVAGLPRRVDHENVEAAAFLGLVEAATRFDPAHGIQFSVYARPRIRGAIMDELRRNCPIPQPILRRWSFIRRVLRENAARVEDGLETIVALTGLSPEEVQECLDAVRLAQSESMDGTAVDLLIDSDNTTAPDASLEDADQRQLLADEIEQLEAQHRQVLSMYYTDDMRLAEIGEVLGLSESRICRILQEAKLLLRERVQRRQS